MRPNVFGAVGLATIWYAQCDNKYGEAPAQIVVQCRYASKLGTHNQASLATTLTGNCGSLVWLFNPYYSISKCGRITLNQPGTLVGETSFPKSDPRLWLEAHFLHCLHLCLAKQDIADIASGCSAPFQDFTLDPRGSSHLVVST